MSIQEKASPHCTQRPVRSAAKASEKQRRLPQESPLFSRDRTYQPISQE